MRYSRSRSRLCAERGAFLNDLFFTDQLVRPNFGFKPEEAAAFLDVRPSGHTNIMVHWKSGGGNILIPLSRVFDEGNLPETEEFAPLRSQLDSWFNDEIINMYLDLTYRKLRPARFCLFGTHFGNNSIPGKTVEENVLRVTRNLKRIGAGSCERAIVPYNLGNYHWVMFYVVRNGPAVRVYYYDSYNGPSKHATYRTLKDLLDELYGKRTRLGDLGFNVRTGLNMLCELWSPGWKEADDLPTTKVGFKTFQKDQINCGVFMCLAASLLMSGHRPEYLRDVDLFGYFNGVHDHPFRKLESDSDFANEEENHSEKIILRMRMLVYNTLRPHVVPYKQPAVEAAVGSDSDVELMEPPKKKVKGGTRKKRVRRRFFF